MGPALAASFTLHEDCIRFCLNGEMKSGVSSGWLLTASSLVLENKIKFFPWPCTVIRAALHSLPDVQAFGTRASAWENLPLFSPSSSCRSHSRGTSQRLSLAPSPLASLISLYGIDQYLFTHPMCVFSEHLLYASRLFQHWGHPTRQKSVAPSETAFYCGRK